MFAYSIVIVGSSGDSGGKGLLTSASEGQSRN